MGRGQIRDRWRKLHNRSRTRSAQCGYFSERAIMRTEEPRPVRLKDYRPPDWLIETVDLDVSLDPIATTVRAKLRVKPNTTGTPAPLILDGDELKLRSLTLDG